MVVIITRSEGRKVSNRSLRSGRRRSRGEEFGGGGGERGMEGNNERS